MPMSTAKINSQAVALVVGASSGIGRAIAERLCAQQYRVYAASRSMKQHALADAILLTMDVTNDDMVQEAIKCIIKETGRLDIVIYAAGYSLAGAIEDVTSAEVHAQFDANVVGMVRVCREVLPIMRKQKQGSIIAISSLAGLSGMPFQGIYSASKFALEGLIESLRLEVATYGIRVILVEPGDIVSGFTTARKKCNKFETSFYKETATRIISSMEHDELTAPSVTDVADLVESILSKKSPRLRYTVGLLTQRLSVMSKRWLPWAWYEVGLRRYFDLNAKSNK
jgi:NAD(P)-dependent dehydrogenase (short-subunit alcohol dehydrogenase family)